MRKQIQKLNSQRGLIVFDAAARLGSFTRAADELKMQQPSVSGIIKQLEASLGLQLFERNHRKIELTAPGKTLFAAVERGLTDIERAIELIKETSASEYVTLNSSSAFSYYWMIPRLAALHEQHPGIDLRMQTSDREPDLDAEQIDLAIRLGNGDWKDCHSTKIADEIIAPVASRAVMESASNLKNIEDLLNERLIHLEEPIRERPTWQQWFTHHGITEKEPKSGLRLNDYALVLQAAVSGEGFSFGWEHIVRNLLEREMLVTKSEWAWNTGRGIYLVWSKKHPIGPKAELVREWIISVSDYPD